MSLTHTLQCMATRDLHFFDRKSRNGRHVGEKMYI
jgi:hypothetical protein